LETEPQLKQEYVEKGLVQVIFKHFPIPSHQHAQLAGVVAECAGQQGKFWEMHDRIFATQEEWASQADARPIFDRLAGEISLDMNAYQACLDDPKVLEEVQRDFNEGQRVGIRGTPNFIVLKGQRGQLIPGALPYDQFEQVLDAALASE
jgi:protein-disulfide isomerase